MSTCEAGLKRAEGWSNVAMSCYGGRGKGPIARGGGGGEGGG